MRTLPLLVPALALSMALPAQAQTLPSEMALDMRAVGEKYVSLAEAMPASAFGWRPAEGVRSVSEVFMHVAAANMGLPASFMGVAPPEGYAQDWFGSAEQITDKAEVVRHLRAAFAHLSSTLEGLTDEQLETPVNVFGRDTNWTGAALLLVTHSHEHLGQAIAYARSNGVTPPWSN
ncbi:MAG: DinB family protein [Gemmatimonadales bacterium]|nr:MAG: DinB family protein [Gemmatimonadales bacterium]